MCVKLSSLHVTLNSYAFVSLASVALEKAYVRYCIDYRFFNICGILPSFYSLSVHCGHFVALKSKSFC